MNKPTFRISIKTTLIVLMATTLHGCLSTWNSEVTLNPTVAQDRSYGKSLDEHSREHLIFDNFETDFTLCATYLSPRFRTSLAKRHEKLYRDPAPILEEATDKAGFFVSVYSPDRPLLELDSATLWTISLEAKDTKAKPTIIKRLDNKELWRNFFPCITKWSAEYLIVFDAPAIQSTDPNLVEKNSVHFIVANGDAQVNLEF